MLIVYNPVNQALRYKKKNILTVASLVLTGVLLLGLSSVLSSINAKDMSLSGFARGQFILRISNQELMENQQSGISIAHSIIQIHAELKYKPLQFPQLVQ